MSDRLVTDLPIWVDFPFPYVVPLGIKVRRGRCDGDTEDTIAFWCPERQRHIDFRAKHFDESTPSDQYQGFVKIALDCLEKSIIADEVHNETY